MRRRVAIWWVPDTLTAWWIFQQAEQVIGLPGDGVQAPWRSVYNLWPYHKCNVKVVDSAGTYCHLVFAVDTGRTGINCMVSFLARCVHRSEHWTQVCLLLTVWTMLKEDLCSQLRHCPCTVWAKTKGYIFRSVFAGQENTNSWSFSFQPSFNQSLYMIFTSLFKYVNAHGSEDLEHEHLAITAVLSMS